MRVENNIAILLPFQFFSSINFPLSILSAASEAFRILQRIQAQVGIF